jgi:hypothetical protein
MKDVTYGSFSCDIKPNKEEVNRMRLTMGGDRINYPDDCGTPTVDMILFKTLVNSTISTPNAKCVMMEIKDFLLANANEKTRVYAPQTHRHPR